MTIIEILLNNSCNRKCAYCVSGAIKEIKNNEYGDYKTTEGIINIVQLKKWLLYQKDKMDDIQLVLSGGEPTICREWTELLEWFHENGFEKPILYTNGLNIRDLINCSIEPNKLVKVLLTHHLTSDENYTNDCINFLNDLNVNFLVKVLLDMESIPPKFENCNSIREGVRKTVLKDFNEAPLNSLDGSSPYNWRWNGYGNKISRERTHWNADNFVLTIDYTGNIFNCHLFNKPCGNIYFPEELKTMQPAACPYPDTFDLAHSKGETRCEIVHYANLFNDTNPQTHSEEK